MAALKDALVTRPGATPDLADMLRDIEQVNEDAVAFVKAHPELLVQHPSVLARPADLRRRGERRQRTPWASVSPWGSRAVQAA